MIFQRKSNKVLALFYVKINLIWILTNKDIHLEEEDIDVESTSLDPRVSLHDVAKDRCVDNETHKEHDC